MACQTVEEEITKNLWHTWNRLGTNINLSYVAVLNLIRHIVSVCRQNDIDIKSLDFNVMIDASLSSDENLTEIDKAFSMMGAYSEAQLYGKVTGYSREQQKAILEQHHTPQVYVEPVAVNPANVPGIMPEPTVIEPIMESACVAANPLTDCYTDSELAEITDYLKRRGKGKVQQPKIPKPKKPKPLTSQEQKILKVSTMAAKKTWRFIKWVLI